jgi:GNAT superfamily N-acetyltransferase
MTPADSPSPSRLLIRGAAPADVEALVELMSSTFRDAYRSLLDATDIEQYIADRFTAAALHAILDDPGSGLIVGAQGGRLLGYALLRATNSPPCVTGPAPIELGRLYVRQQVIGQGHGAALLSAAHAEARRRRCATLWLAVYEGNHRAREFYRQRGFVEVGTMEYPFGNTVYDDPVMTAPVLRAAAHSP